MAKLAARSAFSLGTGVAVIDALASAGRAEAVQIRERPLSSCIDLRLDARNAAARQAVADALGAALPGPNAWVAAADTHILWQAHDEWLLIGADGAQAIAAFRLRSALGGMHYALTDVSDLRAAFELRGPRARDVLQKGCAVDLHPRAFNAGSCVSTALARVRVTLRQMDAAPPYEVLVERSFAGYLWDWFTDAAAEYA